MILFPYVQHAIAASVVLAQPLVWILKGACTMLGKVHRAASRILDQGGRIGLIKNVGGAKSSEV